MIDIVIPFKNEFPNSDVEARELKYAIRSIEQNLTGYRYIYLLTDQPPAWFQNLFIIYKEDYPGRKEYSVYQKLLRACNCEAISEDFVYWNDDHFLLKKLDVSEIKNWHNGPLEKELNGNHSARWRQAAAFTLGFCSDKVKNFDIHAPMIFTKGDFIAAFDLMTTEALIKTHYMKCAWGMDLYFIGEFMEDCNLPNNLTSEEIEKEIDGKLFCSSKGGITYHYLNVLEKLFPNKSRYEK